jgi:hypothetical protein
MSDLTRDAAGEVWPSDDRQGQQEAGRMNRTELAALLETALSEEQARIGDGCLVAGTQLAEALADVLIAAGVVQAEKPE